MEAVKLCQSLRVAFAEMPDHRSAHGRRHRLAAILALSALAMLDGARSLYAIGQWGRKQPEEIVQALGFTYQRTPAVATLHYVFKQVDTQAFERILVAWVTQHMPAPDPTPSSSTENLYGIHGEELPGVRLIAIYSLPIDWALSRDNDSEEEVSQRFPKSIPIHDED